MHLLRQVCGALIATALLSGFVLPAASAPRGEPVIAVTGGRVQGVLLPDGGAVFKGVPFAQPPVANLRWREPMPVPAWSGIRNATVLPPPCPQTGNLPGILSGFGGNAPSTAKEDCLYLNLWTPEWPVRGRMPVMVWIHGGGNFAGAAASDVYGDGSGNTYDGASLSRHGVVVVTANYRLGTLGFLAHPELTKESPHRASGNYGILDQIAALRWVQQNIARFGGDPDNVTIFGESAGAVDVGILMASPLARGLFHRVIAESGTVSGSPRSLKQAELDGQAFARAVGSPQNDALPYLRRLPANDILNAPVPLFPPGPRSVIRHAVLDNYAIPKSPAEVFAAGQEDSVPLLIGNNARERSPSMTALPALPQALEEMYGPLAERAAALYGVGKSGETRPDPLYGSPVEQWAGDTAFRCDSVQQAIWHANAGHSVYEYEFGRAAAGREMVGAIHTAEMWYVFGTLGLGIAPPGPKPRYDDDDRAISAALQDYWTHFAKSGIPNPEKLPPWPRFDASRRAYLEIADRRTAPKEGLRREYCDLYIENAGV